MPSGSNGQHHELVHAKSDGSRIELSGYRGTYPPPEVVRIFDERAEGGAERILAMAEKEQAHQHVIRKRSLTADISSRILGQILGFILGGVSICGSIWLIHDGHSIVGLAAMISGLAILASAFIRSHEPKTIPASNDAIDETESPHDDPS